MVGDWLGYLLSWAAWWLWLLLFLLIALIVYARHESSFALTDLSYTFPLIGKLRQYSRDYSESSDEGWLNVENTLCRDYAKHMSAMSQRQFDNNIVYLKKTYDHGRRPMPWWALTILGLLVVLESLGFSFMLSTLMVTEGTENQHNLLTLAIVLVLASILVWVTHAAGHQLYRTSLLRSCFREYQTYKDKAFSSQTISLDDNQWLDQKQRPHVQCANRVITKPGDRGTYWWVVLALFLISAIAVGSTKLRIDTLHSAPADSGAFISDIFNIDGDQEAAPPPTPAAVADPAAVNAREQAALTGFAMLAVIFVVTQFVGMSLGYWYGFASKQGKDAFRATHGAADYDIYWAPIQSRINIADARLYTLHRLLEQHSPHPLDLKKTFINFIKRERGRGAQDLHMPPSEARALPSPERVEAVNAEEAEGVTEPPAVANEPALGGEAPDGDAETTGGDAAGDEMDQESFDAMLLRLDDAEGKEARIDLLAGLDETLRERLLARLRQRQAQRDTRDEISRQFGDFL
jgi:hypothetical protein